MSSLIEVSWPSDIRPTVQSPFAIIQPLGNGLTRQTKGRLVGEVRLTKSADGKTAFVTLDIVVPALNHYRRRILTASYDAEMIYPALIDADCFRPKTAVEAFANQISDISLVHRQKRPNEAFSENEFRQLLQQVLNSPEVISLASSLIARVNDAVGEAEAKAPADAPPAASEGDGAGENGSEDAPPGGAA
jgi:hypothetical protein